MHLIDLANNIWSSELLETSETTITKINFWLINNLGQLNDLISTNYTISDNDASPELSNDVAAIYSYLYLYRYYQRMIQNNLGASGFDVSEVSEGDSRVRIVSKNEISKSYRLLANDIKLHLDKMVESYKKWQCIPENIKSDAYLRIVGLC